MTIRKIEQYPVAGNLVNTEYLIGSSTATNLKRTMPCNSVVLVNSTFGIDGLIISDKELVNASTRYVRKATESLSTTINKLRPGEFSKVTIKSDNKNRKESQVFLVIFTKSDDVKTGYMFTESELNTIITRTKRIPRTVVRLSLLQKIVLWLYEKIFG